jgi:hypothetical protein
MQEKILPFIIVFYRLSLRLFPRPFRDEFYEEMTSIFSQAVAEAARVSWGDLLVIVLRELSDYPFSLVREHWHNFSHLEPNLMTTIKKPEWFFYPAWILLTVLCVPLAFILYFAIIRIVMIFVGDFIYVGGVRHITEDFLFGYIFIPLTGLLAGLPQYGLLRHYLPRMGWWVLATAGGWLLGLLLNLGWLKTVDYIWAGEMIYSSWAIDIAFVLLGFSIGVAQWLLLQQRLPRVGWWIVANVIGWGLMGLIVGDTFGQFTLLALGMVPASVTVVALALLMNQEQQAEPQGA